MTSSAQATPSWLTRIDEMAAEIVDMTFPIETDTLAIIKKMLLAPGDDSEAVDGAVRDIRAYYSNRLFPPDDSFYRNLPDHGVKDVVGAVVDHVFELAGAIPWRDPAHKRLAHLLIGLKKSAASDFDPENPQLGWSSENLDWHAAEIWRSFHPNHTSPIEECTAALNTHTLLARLVAADMFPADGAWRAATCISEGLQGPPTAEFSTDTPLVRACRAVIATRYIVLAGDVLIRELQGKPGADTEAVVRRGEWNWWSDRVRQRAAAGEGAGDGAEEWDLRGSAEEAREKIERWLGGGKS
ncbi:hypothetical protein C8A01DRAFT_41150 [Parachaetomium inaequale]|uniref:Uncharacterized protein n=1 Tax=Parachaetomium inaequale TaxID=2588326 RepID=A0AAN6P8P6_9PEZI|nr:hypothetical protein C8A01DRAFT_41150 [Parachaetomium inaequale]